MPRAVSPAIRPATAADAAGIAEVHGRQLPDAFLDPLAEALAQRAAWWQRQLASPPTRAHGVWVAEDRGRIVGFVSIGPEPAVY